VHSCAFKFSELMVGSTVGMMVEMMAVVPAAVMVGVMVGSMVGMMVGMMGYRTLVFNTLPFRRRLRRGGLNGVLFLPTHSRFLSVVG
jgi:hypothetical protein